MKQPADLQLKELKKLVNQFLEEISGVPMRAVDCDQDKVSELWDELSRAAKRR